jgi:hypothetical protein
MRPTFWAYMLAELGWKALLVYMIWFWGSPWAGQDILLAVVIISGVVQVTYLVTQAGASANKTGPSPKTRKKTPKGESPTGYGNPEVSE